MNIEKRCNHYRLIVPCMLSGASQGRPVIVGWSIAPCGQVIEDNLGQLPKKLTAGPRVVPRTESSRSQLGTKQGGPPHDQWAKLGQLRCTRSEYAFVVIALFSDEFIALILGVVLLVTTFLFSSSVATILRLFPPAILGVILFFTGAQLALGGTDLTEDKNERFVTAITAALAVWNVGIAFLVGIVAYWLVKRNLLRL